MTLDELVVRVRVAVEEADGELDAVLSDLRRFAGEAAAAAGDAAAPQEVLRRLFPGAQDAARALASLDREGLIALCARALTVLPDEAVRVFAELAGLDEQALRDDPNVGLDGLMEMIGAWMEVNNLENFMSAARALWQRARAGRTGAGSSG